LEQFRVVGVNPPAPGLRSRLELEVFEELAASATSPTDAPRHLLPGKSGQPQAKASAVCRLVVKYNKHQLLNLDHAVQDWSVGQVAQNAQRSSMLDILAPPWDLAAPLFD